MIYNMDSTPVPQHDPKFESKSFSLKVSLPFSFVSDRQQCIIAMLFLKFYIFVSMPLLFTR